MSRTRSQKMYGSHLNNLTHEYFCKLFNAKILHFSTILRGDPQGAPRTKSTKFRNSKTRHSNALPQSKSVMMTSIFLMILYV
eukprot:UN05643